MKRDAKGLPFNGKMAVATKCACLEGIWIGCRHIRVLVACATPVELQRVVWHGRLRVPMNGSCFKGFHPFAPISLVLHGKSAAHRRGGSFWLHGVTRQVE